MLKVRSERAVKNLIYCELVSRIVNYVSMRLSGDFCLWTGYERYNAMRADTDLCFLERVGMPDVTALSAEQGGGEGASEVTDRYGPQTQTHTNTHTTSKHVHKPFSVLK